MKKVIKLLFLLILIIPMCVKALSFNTYQNSINYVNNYINRYPEKNKYLAFGLPYDFSYGKATNHSRYNTGGLLSKEEYELSKKGDSSYLAIGRQYWTITNYGANQYYVDYTITPKSVDSPSGVRVTQFVKPGVSITGSGTYASPWEFKNQYSVTIRSDNAAQGKVYFNSGDTPQGSINKMVDPNSTVNFFIEDGKGYEYVSSDCNLTKVANSSLIARKYKLSSIMSDKICTVNFKKRMITINYSCGDGSGTPPASSTVEYGKTYTVADYTACSNTGYTQSKWKASDGSAWTSGSLTFNIDNGSRGVANNVLNLTADWTANELTFANQTLNAGTYNTAYTSNAFTGASNGTGDYTYTIKSGEPSGATIDSSTKKITFANPTNAGTYNIVVHAKDNKSGAEKDATMKIVINKATPTAPTITGFTVYYDGQSHCATVSGGTSGLTKEYSYAKYSGSTYGTFSAWSTNTSDICATAVNKWRVKVRLKGNDNYNDSAEAATDTEVKENIKRVYICRKNGSHGTCLGGLSSSSMCLLSRTCVYEGAYGVCRDTYPPAGGMAVGYNTWIDVYATPENNRYKIKSIQNDYIYDFDSWQKISNYSGRYYIGIYCVTDKKDQDCASICSG